MTDQKQTFSLEEIMVLARGVDKWNFSKKPSSMLSSIDAWIYEGAINGISSELPIKIIVCEKMSCAGRDYGLSIQSNLNVLVDYTGDEVAIIFNLAKEKYQQMILTDRENAIEQIKKVLQK